MTEPKFLTIIGADGDTGREIVAQAVASGHRVQAAERVWPKDAQTSEGVERIELDVLKDDLKPAFEGVDAVISALGLGPDLGTLLRPPPLYTEGALRICQGMKAAGVRRLVVISASFVEAKDRGPIHFRAPAMLALDRLFTQMGEMERILRATEGIDWTAVRPGWLMDGDLTGDYGVTPDVIPRDLIRTRHADLAHIMLRCVEEGTRIRGTPALARREPPEATSPGAVVREMLG